MLRQIVKLVDDTTGEELFLPGTELANLNDENSVGRQGSLPTYIKKTTN
ncbi:MAG: hypothetical protein ABFS56_18510 [Pseudomonadota bacterium]